MLHLSPALPARCLFAAFAAIACMESVAQAGMPSLSLTDVTRLRFQTISFFVAGVLVSAWGIQRLWNALRKDFPNWPRLTYGHGVAIVVLWGLLFIVVLTMISGARELMTPEAWEKKENGFTYRLAERGEEGSHEPGPTDSDLRSHRREQLLRLYAVLASEAARRDGQFPPAAGIPDDEDAWEPPGFPGARYEYVPGRRIGDGRDIIAFEPDIYDEPQFVLRADGTIESLSHYELREELQAGVVEQ